MPAKRGALTTAHEAGYAQNGNARNRRRVQWTKRSKVGSSPTQALAAANLIANKYFARAPELGGQAVDASVVDFGDAACIA